MFKALFRMGQRKGKRRAVLSTPLKRLTIFDKEKKNCLKDRVKISSSCPLFGRVFYCFYSDLHFITARVGFLHPISRFK